MGRRFYMLSWVFVAHSELAILSNHTGDACPSDVDSLSTAIVPAMTCWACT